MHPVFESRIGRIQRTEHMQLNKQLIEQLRTAAASALKHAYCPYSSFPVGAAVVTADGSIFSGCNVENASLGLTICAERNAVFQAISKGHKRIAGLVIVTPTESPTQPCGACRQVLQEFGSDMDIYSFAGKGKSSHHTLEKLLPQAFGPESIS